MFGFDQLSSFSAPDSDPARKMTDLHYGDVDLLLPPQIVDRPWEHYARLLNPKDELEETRYLVEPPDMLNLSFDEAPTAKLTICILMPNGTVITVEMSPSATFFELKEEVFELAQRGPMYGALRDPKSYRFNYVDFSAAASKDVDDEEIRLCDAQPFGGFIKLLETKKDTASLQLDEQIGRLIGKPLKEFDALRNAEVNEFRYKMRTLCEEIVKIRQNHNWLDKMKYIYPVAHEPSLEVPRYLLRRIPADGYINIRVSFERPAITLDLKVHHMFTPDEILTATMRKLMSEPAYSTAFQQLMSLCEADSYYDTSFEADNPTHLGTTYFLLKINGCLEYLYDCPPGSRNKQFKLIQYKTVRNMLLNDQTVELVAVWKNSIESLYLRRHRRRQRRNPRRLPRHLRPSSSSSPASSPSSPQTKRSLEEDSSGGEGGGVLLNAKRRHTTFSSWSVDRKLVIRIHSASRITYGTDINRISIMAGIFHGGELLVEHYMTTPTSESGSLAKSAPNLVMLDTNHSSFTWDNDIVFNLKVSDLPRMARLCFSVVGFSGNSGNSKKLSKSQSVAVLAAKPSAKLFWGNINFYDYKGILRENSTTLCLWPFDDDEVCDDANSCDSDEAYAKYFNPLGTVVQNPAVVECPLLTISFTKYSEGDNAIIKYPEMKEISRSYASQPTLNSFPEERPEDGADIDGAASAEVQTDPEEEDTFEVPPIRRCASASSASSVRTAWARKQSLAIEKVDLPEQQRLRASLSKGHASKQFLKQISDFCDRDLLYRMTDQECELLMLLREDCKRAMPNALNKLLLSFKWNQQKSVGQVLTLLNDWPKVSPSKALELLDYAYPDSFVRHYAIECLKDMNGEQLSHFLLQLVQALKYESYIYNDLVQFLLERAFENQRIGHQLFWLLRAEMHDPAVSVHFGLILEAYCRGAVDHIHILTKQIECISKLRRINEIIREDKSRDSREKKIVQMQEILKQKYYQETLNDVINPLDPAYKLGLLRINKCKFMDSKMKPLWLVFENADRAAPDIYLMFKNGDDLRQDMLTLQMILIMDYMWKEEGLDLRMTPYKCVSLAKNVGLIEVVLNADTIANIQKEKSSAALAAFRKGSIYSWLKDHNAGEEALKKAVEEFTFSCAGYCVATYVLGIADRHNDNIMVKRNGQLFHIDFGHILGKFKEKFGIRRERVPFVLTHDMVYVISQDKNTERFIRFQSVCEQAFLIIRRRGNFIISLFAMMLSTGIPEVSSVDDLQYLRETLVLDLSEEQARTHFRAKFTEALKNSWKTSWNWCAHSLAKDNRMTE